MTRDDALSIVAMIASHWPGQQWTEETLDAYARSIEPLDADLTMKAVTRCVNELEHYPRVATLREFVRIEKRHADYDDALAEEPVETQRMGEGTKALKAPEWVRGWIVSRMRHRDFRMWPQQDQHGLIESFMPFEAQQEYIEEGRNLSTEMIFRAVAELSL